MTRERKQNREDVLTPDSRAGREVEESRAEKDRNVAEVITGCREYRMFCRLRPPGA
jgi:hypothetical protein